MSHNYLNKSRTQELINTIRGHLSDIATVLSNLASGDARDNTKAPINHNQPSSTINAMTGYTKPQSTSAIAATDTLNQAIGKLEKAIDGAGGGGETIPPIVINKMSNTSTSSSASGNITVINFDPSLIESHPIKFKIKAGSVSQSTLENNKWVYVGPQIITVEVVKHGYIMSGYPGLTSEPNYTNNNYFINTAPSRAGIKSTYNSFSSVFYLGKNPVNSSVIFENNSMSFYVLFGSSSPYYQTLLESIEPIDFTAVTSVTHGGVTVWERT